MSILINDIDVSRSKIIKENTLTHRSRMLSWCINVRLYAENIGHQKSAETFITKLIKLPWASGWKMVFFPGQWFYKTSVPEILTIVLIAVKY